MVITLSLLAAVLQATPGAILIDRNRVDRASLPSAGAPTVAAPPPKITGASTGVPITGIRFVGAQAPGAVAEAARRFIGRAATAATLAELAGALSNAYGRTAVALYTVAIPDQDFARGLVIVSLTEGRIARAQVRGGAGHHPLLRRRMAPLTAESPLTRGTFERQLTLIRAIPGLTADTALTDPGADGALTLTVTPRQRRSKITGGFSSRGVQGLGDGQLDAAAELYGVARDGDQITLAASTAGDLRRFRYASLGYGVPLTDNGLTATANAAYLETRPRGFPVAGTAKQAGAAIAFPLIRGFSRTADVSLGLDGLNSDNAVFGNVVAREHTRALRAAASYSQATARRSASVSASLSHGLAIVGARVDRATAEAGFLKVALSTSAAQAIGKRLVLRLAASGQYGRDRLPAAERFAIGGEAIGRGFDTGLLTGDRGAGGSAEIALRPLRAAAFAGSEVYGFVDGGVIDLLGRGGAATRRYSLASAGAGLRGRYRDKAEIGIEGARVIDDPYAGYPERWRLSVTWRLKG